MRTRSGRAACGLNFMLALDGRAVGTRSVTTEWVNPQPCAATHSVRCADTSPIKGEDERLSSAKTMTFRAHHASQALGDLAHEQLLRR